MSLALGTKRIMKETNLIRDYDNAVQVVNVTVRVILTVASVLKVGVMYSY